MNKIEIENFCYQSYPCNHYCTIDNIKRILNGVQIEKLLRENNMTDTETYNHFKNYRKDK